jgi:hypothetical protein
MTALSIFLPPDSPQLLYTPTIDGFTPSSLRSESLVLRRPKFGELRLPASVKLRILGQFGNVNVSGAMAIRHHVKRALERNSLRGAQSEVVMSPEMVLHGQPNEVAVILAKLGELRLGKNVVSVPPSRQRRKRLNESEIRREVRAGNAGGQDFA